MIRLISPPTSDGFLTLADTANCLDISENALVDLRSKGSIFGYRTGASWKFKIEEISRYIRERGLGPMPIEIQHKRSYKFEAMDATGNEVKDIIDAPSKEEAEAVIRKMGYFVTKLVPMDGLGFDPLNYEPQPTDAVYLAGHRRGLWDGVFIVTFVLGVIGGLCALVGWFVVQ